MDLETYGKRLWALWLTVPTTALGYWLLWDRLPVRIPMKYDMSGRPISWGSRADVMTIALGVLGFVLVVTTLVGYLVGAIWLFQNWALWSMAHG